MAHLTTAFRAFRILANFNVVQAECVANQKEKKGLISDKCSYLRYIQRERRVLLGFYTT